MSKHIPDTTVTLSLDVIGLNSTSALLSDGFVEAWVEINTVIFTGDLLVGKTIEFVIPEWIAEYKGLV